MKRPPLPVILPVAAILFVVVIGGGLGAIFIALASTGIEMGELHKSWGAIFIGLALVILVPTIAALLARPRR